MKARIPAAGSRIRPGNNPRSAFYLAFAYLLWSIVPHFHLLIHSHAGGSHSHASLSGAEVRLANRVLEGLGPEGLFAAPDGETGGAETGRAGTPAICPAGEASLAAGADRARHAHFWEDANLAGAASLPGIAWIAALVPFYLALRYASPSLTARGSALARGPPSVRFA